MRITNTLILMILLLGGTILLQIFLSKSANYAQTECQFRYCGTAIPFLTVRSTARLHHSVSRIFIPFISRRYVWCLSVIRIRHASA